MRFKEIKISENTLNEIKMSPSNLRNVAQSLDATIGIEYEFVYYSKEPKDLSTEVKDINQLESFFENSNNFFKFRGYYKKWFFNEKFNEEYPDFIERFDYYAFRYMEEVGSADLTEYYDDIYKDYERYAKILKRNDGPVGVYNNEDITEEDTENTITLYKLTKNFLKDEIIDLYFEDFLKEHKIKTMKDIAEKFDLKTPDKTFGDIKETLKDDFYKQVNPSNKNYKFVIDESIRTNEGEIPNPKENMIGIEIVSPPQNLQDTIIDFKRIREFIKQNGYVNDTTGLHINVSLSNYDPEKIDYIKLILLLGDNYILNQFNRRSNYFTKSSIDKIEQAIYGGWNNIDEMLTSLKSDMNQLASRYISKRNIDKEMSVNIQPDRVEFRSMGDNWVENNTVQDIINNVFRFIVVLEASMDPEKHQKEYVKKLTKLLYNRGSNKDVIEMFSNYASGNITKEKLMKFLRRRKGQRDDLKNIFDELFD